MRMLFLSPLTIFLTLVVPAFAQGDSLEGHQAVRLGMKGGSALEVPTSASPTGDAGYVITTVAGNGKQGYSGDGGLATHAQLSDPYGVAVDSAEDQYIADTGNHRIRKLGTNGVITTVAGNGTKGYSGDGGPATSAQIEPTGVAVDAGGNLYISDSKRVRKVTASTGIITTLAGGGTSLVGDGGPATSALLSTPTGLAVDAAGNLYIADWNASRVRKVTASTGVITTVAGNGTSTVYADGGNGLLAASAGLWQPSGVALDSAGNLYIADGGSGLVRKVTASTGLITTVAGSGKLGSGYSGDGGPATSAQLTDAHAVAVDAAGNLYIADSSNQRVREVTASTGIISTVAGNGTAGYSGDGGPATSAQMNSPSSVAVDTVGNVYVADTANNAIRQLTPVDTPPPTVAAVVNGASFTGGPAPGSIATLFGANLANRNASAAVVPLPTSLSGVTVTINGAPASLWYVSPTQINFEMPAEIAPGRATVAISFAGASTAPFSFTVPQAGPGIFLYNGNRAVAVNNPANTLTDAINPAPPGSVITVYLTGIGPVKPAVATGAQSPFSPPAQATLAYSAMIGGQNALVSFLGLTPGSIGLAQANITVPNLPPGDYPVVISVGGVASNAATITVGAVGQ